MPTNAQPLRDALRKAEDTVAGILEAREQGRIYFADGSRMPKELFELADVTRLLVRLVAAQQEEIMAMKERLGS